MNAGTWSVSSCAVYCDFGRGSLDMCAHNLQLRLRDITCNGVKFAQASCHPPSASGGACLSGRGRSLGFASGVTLRLKSESGSGPIRDRGPI